MLLDVPSNIHGNRFTIIDNSMFSSNNGIDVILVVNPVDEEVRVYKYERHLEKGASLMFVIEDIAFINENFGGAYVEGNINLGRYSSKVHAWIKLKKVEE